MEKNTEEIELFTFGIFNGCSCDLDLLDFSKLNLRFINEKDVLNLIKENFKDIEEVLKRINEISMIIAHSKYVQFLVPKDFSKPAFEKDIMFVEDLLKILFPSDFTLNFLEQFIVKKNSPSFVSSIQYNFKQSGLGHQNYLNANTNDFKNANKFIDIFFRNYLNISYFKNIWSSYLSSFHQNFMTMEYISLCISLESIIDAKQELNYRIKRNVAILIGKDKQTSNLIFTNIGKIYNLRSSIVHSSEYKNSTLEEYLPYLRDVVSILLIELIFQNISNLNSLNNALTENGFGDKKNLSENYVGFEFYNKCHINIFNTILK